MRTYYKLRKVANRKSLVSATLKKYYSSKVALTKLQTHHHIRWTFIYFMILKTVFIAITLPIINNTFPIEVNKNESCIKRTKVPATPKIMATTKVT